MPRRPEALARQRPAHARLHGVESVEWEIEQDSFGVWGVIFIIIGVTDKIWVFLVGEDDIVEWGIIHHIANYLLFALILFGNRVHAERGGPDRLGILLVNCVCAAQSGGGGRRRLSL